MRFYGKKILKKSMSAQAESRVESRDAIVWDILPDDRVCRVKVQGSNTYIIAHYPENWEQTPFWLKPRNAVRIAHRGGVRGRVEVVGHGRTIPTPVGGSTFPDIPILPDLAISGCSVVPCPDTQQMVVLVTTGQFQIAGITYTLDAIAMSESAIYQMNMGGKMDEIAGAIAITAAPGIGYYRTDIIYVGTDSVLHYFAGTPYLASATEVIPSVPADHLLLGTVFVPSGTVQITSANVNGQPTAPIPAQISVVVADDDLEWTDFPTTNITVTVRDQYGQALNGIYPGWALTLSFAQSEGLPIGNGVLHSAESGDSTVSVTGHTSSGSYYIFTYTRNQTVDDKSPVLIATLIAEFTTYIPFRILLRAEDGSYMF